VQVFIGHMNALGEGIYSLPTEAQWEYACRAGTNTAFANGKITEYSNMYLCNYDANLNAIGWYCHNSDSITHPVALKIPNAWGLYDMHGNVWEWCQDWYGSIPSDPVSDPVGPLSGSTRVCKGGGHVDGDYARVPRSASRFMHALPDAREDNHGFRLLRQP